MWASTSVSPLPSIAVFTAASGLAAVEGGAEVSAADFYLVPALKVLSVVLKQAQVVTRMGTMMASIYKAHVTYQALL